MLSNNIPSSADNLWQYCFSFVIMLKKKKQREK